MVCPYPDTVQVVGAEPQQRFRIGNPLILLLNCGTLRNISALRIWDFDDFSGSPFSDKTVLLPRKDENVPQGSAFPHTYQCFTYAEPLFGGSALPTTAVLATRSKRLIVESHMATKSDYRPEGIERRLSGPTMPFSKLGLLSAATCLEAV